VEPKIKVISKRVWPFFTNNRFKSRLKYPQEFEVRLRRGAILQKWDFSLRKVPLFLIDKDPFLPNSNSSASFSSILFMNLLALYFARKLYF
jgi:hypothetical protein